MQNLAEHNFQTLNCIKIDLMWLDHSSGKRGSIQLYTHLVVVGYSDSSVRINVTVSLSMAFHCGVVGGAGYCCAKRIVSARVKVSLDFASATSSVIAGRVHCAEMSDDALGPETLRDCGCARARFFFFFRLRLRRAGCRQKEQQEIVKLERSSKIRRILITSRLPCIVTTVPFFTHSQRNVPCALAECVVYHQRSKSSEGCSWYRWNRCSRHCPTHPGSLVTLLAAGPATT